MGFWYRFSAIIHLFAMQIIRYVFEVVRLCFFILLVIPMILNETAFLEMKGLFERELSDYEKDENTDDSKKDS